MLKKVSVQMRGNKTLSLALCSGSLLTAGCMADTEDQNETIGTTTQLVEEKSGTRPLLLVLMKDEPESTLAQSDWWYWTKVFGSPVPWLDTGPNVADYFDAWSGGDFGFEFGGFVQVTNPNDPAIDAAAGIVDGDQTITKALKRGRYLAEVQGGVDFSDFDTNGNGTVGSGELTVLVISDAVGGGRQSSFCIAHPSGVDVCSGTAYSGDADQPQNMAHELAHTIGGIDIYGAWSLSCHSYRQTLMSCTSGESSERWYGIDPWHRYKWGWTGSTIDVFGGDGVATLGEVLDDTSGFEFIRLHNTSSPTQSLILEKRTADVEYDQDVRSEGVVAWFVRELSDGEGIRQIESLVDDTKKDKSNFVLAPNEDCYLDPWDSDSRGEKGSLESGKSYRFKWENGYDSGYLITIGEEQSDGRVLVEYELTDEAPNCNEPDPELTPCSDLCEGATSFTFNQDDNNYQSGALGSGAICLETTEPVGGGNCSNVAGDRQFLLNGEPQSCDSGNWSSLPEPRHGGYCVELTEGPFDWAAFTVFRTD